jgi:hypothetical protein
MATTAEQQAVQGAVLRANVSFVEKLAQEAGYEYTSKDRLRRIALVALASLHEVYARALEQSEQVEVAAPEASSLIVPSTEIVTP